jgi:hypothetical protein
MESAMNDADRERLEAIRQGADCKPEGFVSVGVTELRWLVNIAERFFSQAVRPERENEE